MLFMTVENVNYIFDSDAAVINDDHTENMIFFNWLKHYVFMGMYINVLFYISVSPTRMKKSYTRRA